ncbi:MAG TPA: sigma-54 dependent transcriptional regulator [Chromobacteriaceae bacterium]|nr:sigma-54 dependent transcriptional regulator [Chromobacteriaceae bacterium]
MSMTKQLLAIGSGMSPLLSVLGRHGWQVHHVSDVRQLAMHKGVREATVGLIWVDDKVMRQLDTLRKTAGLFDLEWVLLVDRALLAQPVIKHFINDVCYDFHCLPIQPTRLEVTLGRLHGKTLLHRQTQHGDEDEAELELVGEHPSMRQLRQDIRRLARIDMNVLISGESGTGKELVARAIHQCSRRAKAPFSAVNCGGLPLALVQSELFGYERGAFTGATERRIGRIEAAKGGTLFLDEIGDMPIEAQVNLLRFLQEGTIDRLGSSRSLEVDVRVVSATHVDLSQAVRDGRFREDLFYRLNVCCLNIPPLRQRRSDIPILAAHFLGSLAKRMELPGKRFSSEAMCAMVSYAWPGNVREMVNRISQGLAMSRGRIIHAADMGLAENLRTSSLMTLEEARAQAEQDALALALKLFGNNSSEAARRLGVSRATFYRLLQKYQMAEPTLSAPNPTPPDSRVEKEDALSS